ncbi:hypothetical protein B4U79_18247 [Dinothrombium tinctorium]|uniref:Uncharacterized protein n=1 Tax=Dinothrombium tinctorium TaxID=1965070 RepID=A0A443QUA9_9ACAR|nr:hypothetical protein B4U79_18247 [Dinothrombium tinctorium]
MKTNVRSKIGSTPAHDAAALGNLNALIWLVEKGECCLSDKDKEGATVLHVAARSRLKVLQFNSFAFQNTLIYLGASNILKN